MLRARKYWRTMKWTKLGFKLIFLVGPQKVIGNNPKPSSLMLNSIGNSLHWLTWVHKPRNIQSILGTHLLVMAVKPIYLMNYKLLQAFTSKIRVENCLKISSQIRNVVPSLVITLNYLLIHMNQHNRVQLIDRHYQSSRPILKWNWV